MGDIILRINTFIDDDCAESGKLCQVVVRPDSTFTCYHGRAGIEIDSILDLAPANLYEKVSKLADVEPLECHDVPEPTRCGDDYGRLQPEELTAAQLDVVLICYALKGLRTWGTNECVSPKTMDWYNRVADRYADGWLAKAFASFKYERQYFDLIEVIRSD